MSEALLGSLVLFTLLFDCKNICVEFYSLPFQCLPFPTVFLIAIKFVAMEVFSYFLINRVIVWPLNSILETCNISFLEVILIVILILIFNPSPLLLDLIAITTSSMVMESLLPNNIVSLKFSRNFSKVKALSSFCILTSIFSRSSIILQNSSTCCRIDLSSTILLENNLCSTNSIGQTIFEIFEKFWQGQSLIVVLYLDLYIKVIIILQNSSTCCKIDLSSTIL